MSRTFARFVAAIFSITFALLLSGCGGSSSGTSAPAIERSAIVVGKVIADPTAKALPAVTMAAGDPITVYVLSDPDIKATVGADGSFTLRGLPAGSFTLVFMQGTTEVGRLVFDEVAANQQITITVQVVSSEIVLVDEDRRGIGDAGVEIEGLVQNVVSVSTTGDSRFVIAGRSVVARPGVTAIREAMVRKTVNDVVVGKQVHVKGTTVKDSTDVLAYEIMLQNPTTPGTGGTGGTGAEPQVTICHIPPGNPTKPVTIKIGASAWPAHQAHGDKEGACK